MSQFNTRKTKRRKVKIRVCLTIDADLYRALKSKTYLLGTTPSGFLEKEARIYTEIRE